MGPQRRLSAILSADVVGYGKLVRDDETGTIEAVKRLLSVVIAAKLEEHAGRIVKLMGDGVLAEFPSVVEAVNFAVEAQAALAAEDQAIRYRMRVNLGDVIIDGDDIQGDGVNVAARLEAICAPGGLCISDLVRQAIAGKTKLDFEDLGAQNLKNIDTPVRVWQWRQKDLIAGSVQVPEERQITFCTTPDAVSLAYALVGQGPPLVGAPNWMNHLENDWQSEVWRHVLRDMSRHNTLVRFDQRGNGLSNRKVSDLTFDNMVDDMATVANAAGLERFALLGISQGCTYSIAATTPWRRSKEGGAWPRAFPMQNLSPWKVRTI
ncbi:MAG: alpha/beta fold hydrolase [Alphaproteobacteria bacterium]